MKKSVESYWLLLAWGAMNLVACANDNVQPGKIGGVTAKESATPPKQLTIVSQNRRSGDCSPIEIITCHDTTYRNVHVLTVEPDGLTIGYTPKGGGIGLVKLEFDDLPDSLQREFGYDADKAKDFQVEQAQKIASWRANFTTQEQTPSETGTELEALLNAEKTVVLQAKAKTGDLNARRVLAEWYCQVYAASGIPEDRGRALKALEPLAEMDDEHAQFMLGKLLTESDGQDVQRGIKWLRKAAEQGDQIAQETLGNLYKDGCVVTRDPAEAIK